MARLATLVPLATVVPRAVLATLVLPVTRETTVPLATVVAVVMVVPVMRAQAVTLVPAAAAAVAVAAELSLKLQSLAIPVAPVMRAVVPLATAAAVPSTVALPVMRAVLALMVTQEGPVIQVVLTQGRQVIRVMLEPMVTLAVLAQGQRRVALEGRERLVQTGLRVMLAMLAQTVMTV